MDEEESVAEKNFNKEKDLKRKKYLCFNEDLERANKLFCKTIFFESLPTLFIYLFAQLICANILEKMIENQKLKNFPVVIIVDSIIIFMGNLEIAFDMNILNANTLIFLRNDTDSSESQKMFFRHIKKSSIYLFFNAFIVSLITIFITCAYKSVFFYNQMTFKYAVMISLCIIPTCLISMIITIISVVSTILFCKKFNFETENIAMPVVASLNEVVTLLVIRTFLEHSEKLSDESLILLSVFYLILLVGFMLGIYFEGGDSAGKTDITISSPHISTYIYTFIGLGLSACLIEKMSEKYTQIAPVTLVYCGIITNIIMIYSSRVCHRITEIFENGKYFYLWLSQFRKKGKIDKMQKLEEKNLLEINPQNIKENFLLDFRILVEKAINLESMCFHTLLWSSLLLTSIYFLFAYVFLSNFKKLFLIFLLFLFFMFSSVLWMLIMPHFLVFDHWIEKGLEKIDEDLLNGQIGSNTLIFCMISADVFGSIIISFLFHFYYKP